MAWQAHPPREMAWQAHPPRDVEESALGTMASRAAALKKLIGEERGIGIGKAIAMAESKAPPGALDLNVLTQKTQDALAKILSDPKSYLTEAMFSWSFRELLTEIASPTDQPLVRDATFVALSCGSEVILQDIDATVRGVLLTENVSGMPMSTCIKSAGTGRPTTAPRLPALKIKKEPLYFPIEGFADEEGKNFMKYQRSLGKVPKKRGAKCGFRTGFVGTDQVVCDPEGGWYWNKNPDGSYCCLPISQAEKLKGSWREAIKKKGRSTETRRTVVDGTGREFLLTDEMYNAYYDVANFCGSDQLPVVKRMNPFTVVCYDQGSSKLSKYKIYKLAPKLPVAPAIQISEPALPVINIAPPEPAPVVVPVRKKRVIRKKAAKKTYRKKRR